MSDERNRASAYARRLGFKWFSHVRGWERDGRGGALLVRKNTSSGVERTLRVWRFARWDFKVQIWRAG